MAKSHVMHVDLGSYSSIPPGKNYPFAMWLQDELQVPYLTKANKSDCHRMEPLPNIYVWAGAISPIVTISYRYADSWFGTDQRVQRCQSVLNEQGFEYHSYVQENHTIWGGFAQDEYVLSCKGVRPIAMNKDWVRAFYTDCLDFNGERTIEVMYGDGALISQMLFRGAVKYGITGAEVRGIYDNVGVLSYSNYEYWVPIVSALGSFGNYFRKSDRDEVRPLVLKSGNNLTMWARLMPDFFEFTHGSPDPDMIAIGHFKHMLVYVAVRGQKTHVRLGRFHSAVSSIYDTSQRIVKVEDSWYMAVFKEVVNLLRETLDKVISFVVGFIIDIVVRTATFNWLLWLLLAVSINKYIGYFPVAGLIALVSVYILSSLKAQ